MSRVCPAISRLLHLHQLLRLDKPYLVEGVRVRRGALDPFYAKAVLGAVLIGICFVFSASFPLAGPGRPLGGSGPSYFVYRQATFAMVGLVLLYLLSLAPIECLTDPRVTLPAFAVGLGAMIACRYPPFADPAGGAYCWLKIADNLKLQPSEFAKVAYVLMLARCMGRTAVRGQGHGYVLACALIALVLMGVGLIFQEDLGMAMLIAAVTLGMLFLRGINLVTFTALAVSLGGLGVAAAYSSPQRWTRVTAFLHPERDPLGAGYHLCQMLSALARGGVGGLGLGMSPDKWGALPAPHTDSIFCIIGAELGLVGAVALLALFAAMTLRTFSLAERAGTPTAWYTATGLGLLIAFQALINMGVATVSMPCTGITLPFISYGGSSLVASLVTAGLVLSVSRQVALERVS